MANHKRKNALQTLMGRGKREQATTTDTPAPTKPQLLGIELSDTTVELSTTTRPLHATFSVDAHGHTIERIKASYRHSDGDHFIRFAVTASPSATNRHGTTDFHSIADLQEGQQAGTYHPVVIIIDYEDGKSVWLEGEDLNHCAHTIRVVGSGSQTSAPHIGELTVSHSFDHGPSTYLVEALIDAHGDGVERIDLTFSAPTSSDTADVQLVPATEGHYVGLLTINKGESGIWPLHNLVARAWSGESWDWTRGASPPVYALMQAGINVDALAAGEAPALIHDDIFTPTPIEDSSDTPRPVLVTDDTPDLTEAPAHVDHSTNYSLGDYVSDEPHDHIVEYSAVPDESDTADIGPISTKMRTVDTAQTPTAPPPHDTDEPSEEASADTAAHTSDDSSEDEANAHTESSSTNTTPQENATAEADDSQDADPTTDTAAPNDDAHSKKVAEPEAETPKAPQQATATHDTFSEFAPADSPDTLEDPWEDNETQHPQGLQANLDDPWEGDPRDVQDTNDTLYDDPWEGDEKPAQEPRSTLYDDPWADEREPQQDTVIDIRDDKVGTSRRNKNHPSLPEHPNLPEEPKIVW